LPAVAARLGIRGQCSGRGVHDARSRSHVYNHTSGNFLDQIVPGYYYRLDGDGNIATSTCCQNTAPEFAMMEKLMVDTLSTLATQYQVDGFRFDIMGHIPKSAMQHAQAAVDAAAGRSLYYYGEAWNFGEVADGADGAGRPAHPRRRRVAALQGLRSRQLRLRRLVQSH